MCQTWSSENKHLDPFRQPLMYGRHLGTQGAGRWRRGGGGHWNWGSLRLLIAQEIPQGTQTHVFCIPHFGLLQAAMDVPKCPWLRHTVAEVDTQPRKKADPVLLRTPGQMACLSTGAGCVRILDLHSRSGHCIRGNVPGISRGRTSQPLSHLLRMGTQNTQNRTLPRCSAACTAPPPLVLVLLPQKGGVTGPRFACPLNRAEARAGGNGHLHQLPGPCWAFGAMKT